MKAPVGYILIAVWTIGNGVMLLNQGVFWDDWNLYGMSSNGIEEQFYNASGPLGGFLVSKLHIGLNQLPNPPWFYHALAFFGYVLAFLLFLRILELLGLETALVGLILVSLPYNAAKNTMICLPYALSILLFFSGLYLTASNFQRMNVGRRILSLSLFLLSFLVNSLVIFYLILPLIILYYYHGSTLSIGSPRKAGITLLRHFDYLALPFLFFFIKSAWMQPGLHYVRYNQFGLDSIRWLPGSLWATYRISFLEMFPLSISAAWELLPVFLLVGIVVFFWIFPKLPDSHSFPFWIPLVIGIGLFLLGGFPYALVGKIPSFEDYGTRHQLLLPIGSALMITAGLDSIRPVFLRRIALSLLVSIFVCFSISQNLQYLVGSFRNDSLRINFEQNQELNQSNTIQVLDQTIHLNAAKTHTRFYEFNSLAKMAYKTESRLFVTPDLTRDYNKFVQRNPGVDFAGFIGYRSETRTMLSRSMVDYVPGKDCVVLEIEPGSVDPTNLFTMMELAWWSWFSEGRYRQLAHGIVSIRVTDDCDPILVF